MEGVQIHYVVREADSENAFSKISDLIKSSGSTINLVVIKYFTDRLIILKKGEIIELNETDFLFQHPENDYTKSLLKASDF